MPTTSAGQILEFGRSRDPQWMDNVPMGAPPPAGVRITLLGGFAVEVRGQPPSSKWRLRKARTLVKLLGLAPSHRLHRNVVMDMLWPDADPRAASNNLHQVVHAVRRLLGSDALTVDEDLLRLADSVVVDVTEFEAAASNARGEDASVAELRRTLALWTGELLPEDRYEPWTFEPRQRLAVTHATLTGLLGTRLAEQGEPEAALAVIEPVAAERPLDEGLQRALIGALAAAGRRWEAIDAYEGLAAALDEAYAAEPEAETLTLYRQLLTGGRPVQPVGPHNLPESTTSFVGRRRLLAELTVSLNRTRLLTLTGPGGIGKSRLAVELAGRVAGSAEFPDGVWLIELGSVKDPELVVSVSASALQLSLPGDRRGADAFTDQLIQRRLLLVVDNCEHVRQAVAALLENVLARCPRVVVLTTSREPVGLPGEHTYRVPSLQLPDAGGGDPRTLSRLEAVQLFVERARMSAPTFVLDERSAGPVAAICHRTDGIPLALELAAARLAHLSVGELAEGLQEAISLLARGGRAGLDRQQTLAATLDWSHELLESDERILFRRLSVFAGGFDRLAAEAVAALDGPDPLQVLSRLVDKSLVQAEIGAQQTRYRLLEVVRRYAQGRLAAADEVEAIRRRHREWYTRAAIERDPERGGPVVGEPSIWFDVEQDNLRAALASALPADPSLALDLVTATWRFWLHRGLLVEGSRWLTLALAASPERSVTRARALMGVALLEVRQGHRSDLRRLGDQVVDLLDELGTPKESAHGRHQRTVLTFLAGDVQTARAQSQATLRAAEPYPDVTASALHFAGLLAYDRGDPESARDLFRDATRSLDLVDEGSPPFFVTMTPGWSVDLRGARPLLVGEETLLFGRRVGRQQAMGHVQLASALVDRTHGDASDAAGRIDDAYRRFRAIDDPFGMAYALAQRGLLQRWCGDHDLAMASLAEAEDLRRDLREQRAVAVAMSCRGVVAAFAGDVGLARNLTADAYALVESFGDSAGQALLGTNLTTVELVIGDDEAALRLLETEAQRPILPGGARARGWLELVRAELQHASGDVVGGERSAERARRLFAEIGERTGLAAVQSARKAGLVRLPSTQTP